MIPLIHFYSTVICQVGYMNQSVLNDIRNNGYIYKIRRQYKCMKFLNGCSDDQFPMIPRWRYLRWNG